MKTKAKKKPMETLAVADLDIEELERRLELAAPATQAKSWVVCSADVGPPPPE